jgi:Tol biopolymer transport system component
MNVDAIGVRQLTALSGGGGLINPAWSPNGILILAVGNLNPGDNNIYVLNRDGGGLANVSLGDGEAPVWSLDGGRIAFARNRDGNWEIYAVNAQ